MPKPRLSPRSINKDHLAELQAQGADSAVLGARLALIEDEGMRKDLAKLKRKTRCYPEILPTQASLRWSTKNPNLGGFVREFWTQHQGIIRPDPGEWWLEFDWKGIEARLFTAYTGDAEDLIAYSPNTIWCERCGHAHDETVVLACWNPGRGGVVCTRQVNERAGIGTNPSSGPPDDGSGRRTASSGLIPNWGSNVRASTKALEEDTCNESSRQSGSGLDDDAFSFDESEAKAANQEVPRILESTTLIPRQSMGVTCCVCNCTNSTLSEPDIHTLTCLKYLFEWATLPPDWKGKDDERRVWAKNFRYGVLQYGTDERAILGMPGIEGLGLDRQVLVQRAKRFLQARPRAQAWKAQTWQECTTPPYVVRTFMGHRRYLFGDDQTKRKEGTAHKISGSVANMMAWCLIKIVRVWPQMSLILNKHDGAILAFPIPVRGSEAGSAAPSPSDWSQVRAVVEREWEVGPGIQMTFPATWGIREV